MGDLNNTNRSVTKFTEDLETLTTEIQELYCQDQIPWIVGYSGGKDSTVILQLVWNAVAQLPKDKRVKNIYVITTDTLVENPIISSWVVTSVNKINSSAQRYDLPFSAHLLHPEIKNTFWVCLIGKGYPAPRNQFRWCTSRLKIDTANRFIREVIRENGETILVLGTRKSESIKRAITMEKHQRKRVRDRLSPNGSLVNSLIYTPIEDWRTDEVWMYLMHFENPWGQDNKGLFTMYRGATADNECPLVIDTSTPSCGDSRFGCWVCTMVSKDKSMEAMILNDETKEWMQPLLDLRNDLDVKNDREKRDFRRIFGTVQLFERNVDGKTSVEPIPGPYKREWREHWLRRVLEAQVQVRKTAPPEMRDITLIQPEELSEIRRIWLEEKHEFDDSLPRIYQEVTGEKFKDPRDTGEKAMLGPDEWQILEDLSDGDPMYLELVTRLLDTERQYKTMARRTGIYDTLERCFKTSSRSQNEAIQNAHYERNLKEAAQSGKVEDIKKIVSGETPEPAQQLSWASLKFNSKQ